MTTPDDTAGEGREREPSPAPDEYPDLLGALGRAVEQARTAQRERDAGLEPEPPSMGLGL